MDSDTQLRLATRIHSALLRYLGTGIDVASMLSRKSYAREVIYVCSGCSDPELNALAKEYVGARKAAREARSMPLVERRNVPTTVPMLPVTAEVKLDPEWARDSSNFSPSELAQSESPPDDHGGEPRKRWFDPARWLRRESGESSR